MSHTKKRFAMLPMAAGLAILAGAPAALAQEAPAPVVAPYPAPADDPLAEPDVLEEVVVTGRQDNLVGIAATANEGTVGAKEIARRPLLRPGELMEAVPGLVISQHSGAGKANQYYLRGMNLDHGTDFSTWLDGMPLNLPTHGHGQGYLDLNFLIPELVRGIRYEKGTYSALAGDFSAVGSSVIDYFSVLPQGISNTTIGSNSYNRLLVADSPEAGKGRLLYGLELFQNDGPWVHPDDQRKVSGVLRYSEENGRDAWHVTAMAYDGKWNATDQIPKRAIDDGSLDRYGAVDPTDGGDSYRYSLSGKWGREERVGTTEVNAYAVAYRMNLYSNFTYFLDDPEEGDQFQQADRRRIYGAAVQRRLPGRLYGRESETIVGLQLRHDDIPTVGLYHTKDRQRLGIIRKDSVDQTSAGLYVQNETRWTPTFRSILGLRADAYRFHVDSNIPENSGNSSDSIVSPKLSFIFGPWKDTEFYLNGGYGYHSNDARGVTIKVDPQTGEPAERVTPLVRAKGAEIGVRSAFLPNLQSTLSLWHLKMASELLFSGDAGITEPSRPSRRTGLEFTNFYTLSPNWTVDADYAYSWARFRDSAPEGNRIPGALEGVLAAGISYNQPEGWFGSLRVRYFGPRPLVEDNSVRSSGTTLFNGRVGRSVGRNTRLALDVYNLFNSRSSDIDYWYTSRLPGEPAEGVDDIHLHPAEPRTVRLTLSASF